MRDERRRWTWWSVVAAAALVAAAVDAAPACVGSRPPAAGGPQPQAVRAILAAGPGSMAATEVLVLGTPHLSAVGKAFDPAALAPVVAALLRWRPTIVCVESLVPEDIAAMIARGGRAAEVASMFAAKDIEHGTTMQRMLAVSRDQASATAAALLAAPEPTAADRAKAVGHLLAAFDQPSAVLQWTYLDAAQREQAALPPEVAAFMEESAASPDETSSLAVPVARAMGIARLHPFDSQWDGARLLALPEADVEELFNHPRGKAAAAEHPSRGSSLVEAGRMVPMLPVYLRFNSGEFARLDVRSQWGWLLDLRLASGLDRFRLGQWQSRNLRMAANLADAINTTRAERVLVVVGAAHRPFLEDYLGRLAGVEIVPFASLAAPLD